MGIYSRIGANHPGRTAFNLTHTKTFDGDMGALYPIAVFECMPGDTFKLSNVLVTRFQPMVAPILQEVNEYVHWFFVPTRLLWTDSDIPQDVHLGKEQLWENFLTGGKDGTQFNDESVPGSTDLPLPRWIPQATPQAYSLWDYLGYPLVQLDANHSPLAFVKRAYNFIWNEYYRAVDIQDEVDLDSDKILYRCWEKDYFTSALPWQQRGTAPALPVTGNSVFDFSNLATYMDYQSAHHPVPLFETLSSSKKVINNGEEDVIGVGASNGSVSLRDVEAGDPAVSGSMLVSPLSDKYLSNNNSLNTVTFDVSDLRLAFQVQKWLELNARAGAGRYKDFLLAHFGVAPKDERLQRPEYIGGMKSPVIISEVLQTSGTQNASGTQTTPQGNLAGHGIVADSEYCGTYHCQEFGYIIGLLSVMPRTMYQQGIEKSMLRRTRYDFPFPEFVHLSEQAIETAEIYAGTNDENNSVIFGYQGRYNELRSCPSKVVGGMRDTFDFWHISRQFGSAPLLNSSFLECKPRKDYLAVPSKPAMIFQVLNKVTAIRPLPYEANPGLIDHV